VTTSATSDTVTAPSDVGGVSQKKRSLAFAAAAMTRVAYACARPFSDEAQADEVEAHGLDCLDRRAPGVLDCVAVDREAVQCSECRVAVLAREHLPVDMPTPW
jgi:hypothetical protein